MTRCIRFSNYVQSGIFQISEIDDRRRKLTIELELRNLFGFYILKKRIHSLTCDLVGILSD